MRLSELTENDVRFMEEYEAAFKAYNILFAFGNTLTEKDIEQKKKLSDFMKDNLSRYMDLTN